MLACPCDTLSAPPGVLAVCHGVQPLLDSMRGIGTFGELDMLTTQPRSNP